MFHVAIGAIGMACAYLFYQGFVVQGSLLLGMIYALIGAIVLGVLADVLLKDMIEKDASLLGLLVSFGMGIILEGVVSIVFSTSSKTLLDGSMPVVALPFGLQLSVFGVLTILLSLVVLVLIGIAFKKTPFGRSLRSVSENKYVVLANGVDPNILRLGTFVLASVLVSIITIFVGFQSSLTPLMGFPLVVSAFVVLLVGGLTDVRGLFVATLLLIVLPEIFIAYSSGVSGSWKMVIMFAVASVCLLWRPNGLFENLTRRK